MTAAAPRLTVLQAKFSAYLSWSQPFLHALLSGLDPYVRNVILCNRTENLDRFPVRRVERLPNRYLAKPRLAVLSARYLRRTWNPDLIHAHFGWSGIRLLLLKQMLRVPLVVTFGGRDVGLQMQLPDFDRLYRALLGACDGIVCVSADLRDKLAEAGVDPARIRVVHRGTDLHDFAFVDRSGRPEGAPVRALMVGRIVEKKGHRYAVDAVAGLAREGREVRLVVVGEGEAYHDLRRLRRRLGLGDRVEFAGSTDHAGVRRHMAEADLLVHCSHTPESGDVEGIPNVVVEAQATGLPVVATRHGGIAEAVRHGETGLLVPERDAEALRAAIGHLAADRAERLAMGVRARRFVTEELDLERQVEAHRALYAEVVEGARSAAFRERNWIPDDYAELVGRTVLAQDVRHPSEFSIAELLERLVWMRRYERRFAEEGTAASDPDALFLPEAARLRAASGEAGAGYDAGADLRHESRLERVYNWKSRVPQSVKFPAKMALGRLLVWAIEQRHRRLRGEALEALEQEDERVVEFFRSGGSLEAWEAAEQAEAAAPASAQDPPTAAARGRPE